jgi:hypothetical protein
MKSSQSMSHISLIVLYCVVPVCCLHQHLLSVPEPLLQQLEIVRSALATALPPPPHLQTLSYCSNSWLATTRFLKISLVNSSWRWLLSFSAFSPYNKFALTTATPNKTSLKAAYEVHFLFCSNKKHISTLQLSFLAAEHVGVGGGGKFLFSSNNSTPPPQKKPSIAAEEGHFLFRLNKVNLLLLYPSLNPPYLGHEPGEAGAGPLLPHQFLWIFFAQSLTKFTVLELLKNLWGLGTK